MASTVQKLLFPSKTLHWHPRNGFWRNFSNGNCFELKSPQHAVNQRMAKIVSRSFKKSKNVFASHLKALKYTVFWSLEKTGIRLKSDWSWKRSLTWSSLWFKIKLLEKIYQNYLILSYSFLAFTLFLWKKTNKQKDLLQIFLPNCRRRCIVQVLRKLMMFR